MGLCLIRKRYYFYYRTLTKKYRNGQHSFRFVFKERTLRRSRERFLRSISNKSLSGSAEAGGSYGDPICGSPSRCQEMQSPSSRPEPPSHARSRRPLVGITCVLHSCGPGCTVFMRHDFGAVFRVFLFPHQLNGIELFWFNSSTSRSILCDRSLTIPFLSSYFKAQCFL